MHQLRLLDLDDTAVTDLSPLISLSYLETLLCLNTKISDLTPLLKCSELKALDISATEVQSLIPLLQCKKLKYLNHSNLEEMNEDQTIGYIKSFVEYNIPGLISSSKPPNKWMQFRVKKPLRGVLKRVPRRGLAECYAECHDV